MIGKEIIQHKPVPLAEVHKILVAREEEDELGFEQKNALEYSGKFSHVSPEKAEELMNKLMELPFVSDAMAVKLVDLLPKDENLVKLIFAQEKRDLTEGEIKEVLDIISKL